MTRKYDLGEIMSAYELPDLPDAADDGDATARILILFRRDEENIVLTLPVSLGDVTEYTNREDTHGDGWFVGRDTPNDYEPGEVY